MLAAQIESLVPPGAILIAATFSSAEEVIRALSAKLRDSGHVKESHAAAVLTREAIHPTGLPTEGRFSVAIPHTDPDHVLMPAIAIATMPRAISFQNMEDPDEALPVRLVFMLAFTDKDKQIEALQMVAGLLQSPDVLEAIATAKKPDEILDLIKGAAKA